MNKKILTTLIAASLGLSGFANANTMENLRISGFGSVGVGISDNDAGYAGFDSEAVNWEQETLGGIQFDFDINDRAKFVTQIVANGRYDFDPKIEMAYASYDFDQFTARAGKLRLPLFFYSDFMDLGYASPMIRPSQEVYENIVMKGYTGAELLIPVELENSSLLIQPLVGVGVVEEEDSSIGEVSLDNLMGVSANWNYQDITLRGSYMRATAKNDNPLTSVIGLNIDDQDGQFISLGAQYDNGTVLLNVEAADAQMDGNFYDTRSVTGLAAYRIDAFTPYVSFGWVETTDNDDRIDNSKLQFMNYERTSYAIGSRWDFAPNMAVTVDVTYADFNDTSGGMDNNTTATEDDSLVYSARLDFVF